jgi:flagellar hook-associated protein 1 FlgK
LLVSNHAQSVSSAKAEQAAADAQKDGALLQLDEVTGVDLDVEAAQLLRFQQAYSASSRIIQVARDTLQEIFGLFN